MPMRTMVASGWYSGGRGVRLEVRVGGRTRGVEADAELEVVGGGGAEDDDDDDEEARGAA